VFPLLSPWLHKFKTLYGILEGYLTKVLPRHLNSTRPASATNGIYLTIKGQECFQDNGRYLFILIKTLSAKFPNIYINRFNLVQYYQLGQYGRCIYDIASVSFTPNTLRNKQENILIFDRVAPDSRVENWKKSIQLKFDISVPQGSQPAWALMPYPMHPNIYQLTNSEAIKPLRHTHRTIALLFAGSTNPQVYSGRGFWQHLKFEITPRAQIIESIKHHLSDQVWRLQSYQDLEAVNATQTHQPLVLSENRYFHIPQQQWLPLLARCEFFLCAPGIDMPLCHNAIEAMAVGTIPLINYPHWFSPNLKDLENCIYFADEVDLINKIKLIWSMPSDQVLALRKNVITYYENYLCLESFYDRLLKTPASKVTLFVNIAFSGQVRGKL
jgi:hypothetical protein